MFKRAVIASIAVALTGCMGTDTGSSSSELSSSSVSMPASVSSTPISSLAPVSSSLSSSSSSVLVSSASSDDSGNGGATVSSAPSSPAECSSLVEEGSRLYNEPVVEGRSSCIDCHGDSGADGITAGDGLTGGVIRALEYPFGNNQPRTDLLGAYITNFMGAFVGGCDVACGEAIAAYLTAGTDAPTCGGSDDGNTPPGPVIAPDAAIIPSRVESENFMTASDTTEENLGSCGDQGQSVDLQPKVVGGGSCDVNWTAEGEWLEYKLHALADDSFDFYISLAAFNGDRTVTLSINNEVVGSATALTNGWTSFGMVKAGTMALTAGEHILRVRMNTGGLNIDALDIRKAGTEAPYSPTEAELQEGFVTWTSNCYSCHGKKGQGGLNYPSALDPSLYSRSQLIEVIYKTMPPSLGGVGPEESCDETCASNVADFIIAGYPGVQEDPILGCDANPLIEHVNTPIRLLTTQQFARHVQNVFGPANLNVQSLTPEGTFYDSDDANGFVTNTGITPDRDSVEKMIELAEAIGTRVSNNFGSLMSCNINADCVKNFIRTYGEQLYRDSITNTQVNELFALFEDNPNRTGVAHVTAAMLLAGSTLYQYEVDVDSRQLLQPREIADRLAFLIWGKPADKALLDKANRGELNTPGGLRTEALAMLRDSRAEEGLRSFYADYLDIPPGYTIIGSDGQEREMPKGECGATAQCQETLYPGLGANDCSVNQLGGVCLCGPEKDVCAFLTDDGAVAESGVEFSVNAKQITDEISRFANYLTRSVDGSFSDLFMSRAAFVDETMAKIYDVPVGQLSSAETYMGGAKVELPAERRAGLLSRAAFVITGAGDKVGLSSPTQRGEIVRKHILCQEPPAVPGDVPFPDLPDPSQSTWVEVLKEVHLKDNDNDPSTPNPCVACHQAIDPIGFAFEHYTLNGQFIDAYPNGTPIDSSGKLYALFGDEKDYDDIEFADALELSAAIGNSEDAAACFAETWMSYALSRPIIDSAPDSCAAEYVAEAFKEENYSLSGLITAIVTNPSFRYRNPE